MIKNVVSLIAAATVLGACSEEPAPAPMTDDASASGNVLEGSINDEMLPLDTVQSQSPPAAGTDSDGEGDEGNGEDAPE